MEEDEIIVDYFNFELNDIELYHIKRKLEINMNLDDISAIKEDINEFIMNFRNEKFDSLYFPYLKTSVIPHLDSVFSNYSNINSSYYYMILFLSHKNLIYSQLKNFYYNVVSQNNFGLTEVINSAITNDVKNSDQYIKFVVEIAEWYTKIELIIFYITALNHLFPNIIFIFNEKNYTIENNYKFSFKSFAKKHFLKLVSYIFKNTSINTIDIDYKKLAILFMSSFTYGLTYKEIFSGAKTCAYVGGIIFNYLLGKLSIKIDQYSSFIEFSRLEKVVNKLNNKLERIRIKLYELFKILLSQNKKLDIDEKIKFLNLIIEQSVSKIEDISEMEYIYEIQELSNLSISTPSDVIKSSTIIEDWLYVKKNSVHN